MEHHSLLTVTAFQTIPCPVIMINQFQGRISALVQIPFTHRGTLTQITARAIENMGFSLGIDRPYAGTLVPMVVYMKDRRVASIMIEVNRSLYMNELSGMKTNAFDQTKEKIQYILKVISELQQQSQPDVR